MIERATTEDLQRGSSKHGVVKAASDEHHFSLRALVRTADAFSGAGASLVVLG